MINSETNVYKGIAIIEFFVCFPLYLFLIFGIGMILFAPIDMDGLLMILTDLFIVAGCFSLFFSKDWGFLLHIITMPLLITMIYRTISLLNTPSFGIFAAISQIFMAVYVAMFCIYMFLFCYEIKRLNQNDSSEEETKN